jgi:hypothetical protein
MFEGGASGGPEWRMDKFSAGDLPAEAEVTRTPMAVLNRAESGDEQVAGLVRAFSDLESRYLRMQKASNSTLRRVADIQRSLDH